MCVGEAGGSDAQFVRHTMLVPRFSVSLRLFPEDLDVVLGVSCLVLSDHLSNGSKRSCRHLSNTNINMLRPVTEAELIEGSNAETIAFMRLVILCSCEGEPKIFSLPNVPCFPGILYCRLDLNLKLFNFQSRSTNLIPF